MRRIVPPILCLTFSLAYALANPTETAEPLDIDSRLELFVDDHLIESMKGVRLKLHEPRSAVKLLTFDRPWEGNLSIALGLLKHDDRYRLYYRGT